MRTFTVAQARALTLASLGFAKGRPARKPGDATVRKAIRSLGLLQIDSVNVLTRAHTMPLFSRLGPYDRGALDRLAYKRRALFEYWAHEACLLPIEDFPLHRSKMLAEDAAHPRFREWVKKTGTLVDDVLAEVRERGPIGISEVTIREGRNSPWWGWPPAKSALEWLFITGAVTTHSRRNFERIYDLTERVIPAEILGAPVPERGTVRRELLLRAAASLAIGTAADLTDYWRLQHTRTDLAALVARCAPAGVGGVPRARVAVRSARVAPQAQRAPVRLRLQDRDLRPRTEACVRVLRAAIPARRPHRGAGRSEGRSRGERAARAIGAP
jgi:uncharacterized protein